MRVLSVFVGILALAQSGFCAQPQQPIPAGQLVREVVFNELNDHQGHGYWRYWVKHHTPKETRIEEQVETAQGPVTRLTMSNGLPPSQQAEAEDQARLQRLLNSPGEQAKHLHEYEENENSIGRILALLPDAFLYDYDGDENGCYRLRFRPNPVYPPHSIEARVFHSMSGTLWIDARYKHLARLEGQVQENLDFGYGILGRLYKGGWFKLERTQVSPTDWKTVRLEVHICGRALMVKSFARENSETRGGFAQVPAGMNLAQGMALLQQIEAHNQAPPLSRRSLATSAAFAPRR